LSLQSWVIGSIIGLFLTLIIGSIIWLIYKILKACLNPNPQPILAKKRYRLRLGEKQLKKILHENIRFDDSLYRYPSLSEAEIKANHLESIRYNRVSIPNSEVPIKIKSESYEPSGVHVELYDRATKAVLSKLTRPKHQILTTKEKYLKDIIKTVKKLNNAESLPPDLIELLKDLIDDTLTLEENYDLLRHDPMSMGLSWPK
jgi:hypothetical protein